MRFRTLGRAMIEIESGPYRFLVSRGKVIGLKDTAHPGLVFRSNNRGGKDVKSHTRHLNQWGAGLRPTEVSQTWLDDIFEERHTPAGRMTELLAGAGGAETHEKRERPDRRHRAQPFHPSRRERDRRDDPRGRWRSSRSA